MRLDRRALFTSLAGAGLLAAAPAVAAAEPTAPEPDTPRPKYVDRLRQAVLDNRRPIALSGTSASGPGWDWLVAEAKQARFFAVGEEHGVAQVPALVSALMKALGPAGYSRMVLEISPALAPHLDRAATGGLDGLKAFYRDAPPGPVFYTMAEEARMLAEVRPRFRADRQLIFGVDYEITMDRLLIAGLKARAPAAARPALAALDAACNAAWAAFKSSNDIGQIFSFSGDPALVEAVQAVWPNPDAASAVSLETLRQTLIINGHQTARRYFQSNATRALFMRANLVRQFQADQKTGGTPRTLFKMGAGHLVRGRSPTELYDVGNLISEAATLRGETSFHLLAIPGAGGRQAVFNPSAWTYQDTPSETLEEVGMTFLADLAFDEGSTLVDLRPLRQLMPGSVTQTADPNLSRIIHGYDALLLIGGATASRDL